MSRPFIEVKVTVTKEIEVANVADMLECTLFESELPDNGEGLYSTFDDLNSDDVAKIFVAIAEYWLQKYTGKQD